MAPTCLVATLHLAACVLQAPCRPLTLLGMATKAANYAKLECIVRALFPTPGVPDEREVLALWR